MVHRSGDVLTKARDDAARITRELVADSVDGKWDANVRWPTPTLALARAELARRGIATSETTSDALANILDEAVEELAVALPDGWDSAGVAVAEMSGRVVEHHLRLRKVRVPDGASNDAKRALLVGRLESLAMLKELTLVPATSVLNDSFHFATASTRRSRYTFTTPYIDALHIPPGPGLQPPGFSPRLQAPSPRAGPL